MDFKLKKSELNFRVYTVDAKPTAPGTNNDIAVISSVPMTNWSLSPDAPSGIPRSDGDVWIQYSVTGKTFDTLKNNSMIIATISAWQYVDGAWTSVTAVSCQSGEWVDWIIQLYDLGNEFEAQTGGWSKTGYTMGASGTLNAGTKNADNMTLTGASSTYAMLGTANPINVDNFKTLCVDGEPTGINSNNRSIVVAITKDKKFYSISDWLDKKEFPAEKKQTTVKLDLSDIDGDVYVVVFAFNSASCHGKVYKVWME